MKYLVYYDTPENIAERRYYALAAANKIDYICAALNRIGEPVELISASVTGNKRGCRGKQLQLSDQITLKLFSCLGGGALPKRALRRLLFDSKLFFYFLLTLKNGEDLLVYHSLGYSNMVWFLRKLKKFRLVLEVEEIYADVSGVEKDRKKEFRLFSAADAFIFPTELLNKKINVRKKPYTLIHGTYQVEPDRGSRLFGDDKIHCVYAGTFDPRKGGAMAAVAAAAFLPEGYHLHILGDGEKETMQKLHETIAAVSQNSKCGVSYDGLLLGDAYVEFLQSCDIGLCTQNPDAAFNDTSFPSKILSYMANGLRVVSVRIPAVERSAIGPCMYYYDRQTPEEIACAIQKVDLNDGFHGRSVLDKLDKAFGEKLENLFMK